MRHCNRRLLYHQSLALRTYGSHEAEVAAAAVVPRAAVAVAVNRHRVREVGGGGVDAHEAAQVRDQDVAVLPAHLVSYKI